ncbi:MAG: glycoside hydrolase family 3 protein [Bacteroidota bacterium]
MALQHHMSKIASPRALAAQCIMPDLQIDDYLQKPDYRDKIHRLIEEGIGGFCIFKATPDEAARVITELQARAAIPLLFSADFEFGTAMRLEGGTAYPHSMALGKGEVSITEEIGREIAKEAKQLGVHWNFAPVCDVNSNPDNPIISIRSFGETSAEVSPHAVAYIRGTQSVNVIACAKHFPGHGDTTEDSHMELPVLNFDRERFDALEFVPFKEAMQAGVRSVMVAHLSVPALQEGENLPASLSRKVMTNVLKNELGFKGLVVTDALDMKAIADTFKSGEASVMALKAGADIVLMPVEPFEALDAIEKALENGGLSIEEVKESVEKIIGEKEWCGLLKGGKLEYMYTEELPSKLALMAARTAIEVSGNKDLLPLDQYQNIAGFALMCDDDIHSAARFFQFLAQTVEQNSDFGFIDDKIGEEDLKALKAGTINAELVIFAIFSRVKAYNGCVGIPQKFHDVARYLGAGKKAIAVVIGHPYENDFPADTIIYTYSDSLASIAASALVLGGRQEFDTMEVDIVEKI